jgi:hypothetical protein
MFDQLASEWTLSVTYPTLNACTVPITPNYCLKKLGNCTRNIGESVRYLIVTLISLADAEQKFCVLLLMLYLSEPRSCLGAFLPANSKQRFNLTLVCQ